MKGSTKVIIGFAVISVVLILCVICAWISFVFYQGYQSNIKPNNTQNDNPTKVTGKPDVVKTPRQTELKDLIVEPGTKCEYDKYGDYVGISGYVKNIGGTDVKYVKLFGALSDKDGKILAREWFPADGVLAGGRTPFFWEIKDPDRKMVQCDVWVIGALQVTQESIGQNLTIDSDWICTRNSIGYVIASGKINNAGKSVMKRVKLRAVIFDKAGRVINTQIFYADSDEIPVEGSSTFSVSIPDRTQQMDHCQISAESIQ